MAIYALQETRHENNFGDVHWSRFLHEFDNVSDMQAHIAGCPQNTKSTVKRVSRPEAMRLVKQGVIHGTRFWLDGGTVKG